MVKKWSVVKIREKDEHEWDSVCRLNYLITEFQWLLTIIRYGDLYRTNILPNSPSLRNFQ